MSLQIWLPLNGSLENQGINSSAFTSSATYDNNGKIGKCLSSNINLSVQGNLISKITLKNQYSFALWMKNKNASGWAFRFGDINGGTSLNSRGMWLNINGYYEFAYQGTGTNIDLASTICDNNWHHIVYVVNDKSAIIYVDGKLVKNLTLLYNQQLNYEYIQLNGDISYINDFRIYDHCLSAKEVKELAKGLVLHYRLAGPGQENLAKNSGKYTILNKVTMTTASTDGIMCPGIYYNNFNTTKQYTLTVECDGTLNTGHGALRTPADRYWTIWIYYHDTPFTDTDYYRYQIPICYNSSSSGFKKISDNKYSWTFTPSKANGSIRLNTYSDGTNVITVKFWNIKIEEGSVATPWCPNPADPLYHTMGYDNNIEYDCSGYCRNGTKNGTITWDIDSPRYTTSYNFSNSGYIYNNSFGVTTKEYTISLWIKLKPATSQHFLFGTFDSWTGNGIGFYRDANQLGLNCIFRSNGESSYGSLGTAGLSVNTWYMVTYTSDGTTIKRYLNGVYQNSLTYGKGGNTLNPVFYIANSKYNGTPTSENEEALISDVRFYATALSDSDIAELYHSAVIVDNTGKSYAYEYFET